MPVKMKVSNCYEYNKFLQKRGNVFHFVNQAIENWYENSPKVAGGNNIYSDKVVILIHIVVHFFRIGLRQAVGFVKGCIEQMGKDLKVISYTQASRRFKKLNLKIDDCRIDKNGMENIEIAIDSTSICIYNNTHQRNKENAKVRKYNGYDQVRKLHIILSINNKKVIDMKCTNGTTLDYHAIC
ncbi:transposase [Wolbachia endosymbiont of Frankliniella intonsa]|uniref:transposase n=1 Tax=Wolbachia endosymbiont of Frankliniella intonsa TaxID=2902422 RepID=UPI00244E8D28|nr:transposase [Wolbachia endosymbiont of Frankliniella intonsa]WGJ62009.1 transposase [Wolbachia endosymbiont of Frankliniella intonsa]